MKRYISFPTLKELVAVRAALMQIEERPINDYEIRATTTLLARHGIPRDVLYRAMEMAGVNYDR